MNTLHSISVDAKRVNNLTLHTPATPDVRRDGGADDRETSKT